MHKKKCKFRWAKSLSTKIISRDPTNSDSSENGTNIFRFLSQSCFFSSGECDVWLISFTEAENKLIGNGCRKKCLSILKTLRDRYEKQVYTYQLMAEPRFQEIHFFAVKENKFRKALNEQP